MGSSATLADLDTCVSLSTTEVQAIIQAVSVIEQGGDSAIIEGIWDLIQAAKDVPQAISTCKGLEQEGAKLIAIFNSFSTKLAFLEHMGFAIIENHTEILN